MSTWTRCSWSWSQDSAASLLRRRHDLERWSSAADVTDARLEHGPTPPMPRSDPRTHPPDPALCRFPDAKFALRPFQLLPKTTWGTPSFSVLLGDVANMKNFSPAARLSRDGGDVRTRVFTRWMAHKAASWLIDCVLERTLSLGIRSSSQEDRSFVDGGSVSTEEGSGGPSEPLLWRVWASVPKQGRLGVH